jgi:AraC family transcriptional regulator
MRDETAARNNERIGQVLTYVAGQMAGGSDDRLTLERLSRRAQTAPFHLHRIFRQITGEPMHRYIRRLRLEYAAYRLLFTTRPVIDIALDAGYESHPAFSRAFKQWCGVAPARFRADPGSARLPEPTGSVAPVPVRAHPRRVVAFARYFGPYTGVGEAWQKLATALDRRGIAPESSQAVGIVYDSPEFCFTGGVRYDACVVAPDDISAGGSLGVKMVEEMDAAMIPHTGPPELVVCTYVRLMLRLATCRGERATTEMPFYEMYERYPFCGPNPAGPVEVHVEMA